MELNKNEYSMFKDLKEIENLKEKKEFIGLIEDFINCVCELCDINRDLSNIQDINLDFNILNFIINMGLIKSMEDIDLLEKILGNNYNKLLKVINICINNNIDDQNIMKFLDSYRKKEVEKYLNDYKSPTVVDFFCGSGGLSLGFHREGFKILLANDIEEVCIKTYSYNHCEIPKSRIIQGDIKLLVENIDNIINQEVDVVLGGPPCQGFSMANRQRIIDDPRNVLYKYYVEAIGKLKPKFFIMENVKGMLNVANQVKEDFKNLGDINYDVYYNVFNAKDFSVPQNRERLIYIGVRNDISKRCNINALNLVEEIKHECNKLAKYELKDALYGLRELKALTIKNSTELDTEESGKKIEKSLGITNEYINLINAGKCNKITFNHKARFNNERDIEIYNRMLPGDKSDSPRIADIMPYKDRSHIFKDKYYKLKMNEVCKTITAHMKFDCNMYIHPEQARGLTPREAARVQSYPDDYVFLGAYTKTYMQIGNSVPPQMANIIAKVIKKYL